MSAAMLLRGRRLLLAGGATAAGAAAICAHSVPHSLQLPDVQDGPVIEAMQGVPRSSDVSCPNGVLYLAPATPSAPPSPATQWPKVFSKGVVYAVTASNPNGERAPTEWNAEANSSLAMDITKMARPCEPRAWWRMASVETASGRRVDGFGVAFASEERALALPQTLRLAQKYSQPGVDAYRVEDGKVVRERVWLDPAAQAEHGTQKEAMRILPHPPTVGSRHAPRDDGPSAVTPRVPPTGLTPNMFGLVKKY